MDRFLMTKLIEWKTSRNRKPLIVNGARQVGKTWLLKEFGRQEFQNVVYINFDNNPRLAAQFDEGYHIPQLIAAFQLESGERIDPEKTLIILDEIQECPKALTSLKYFYENAPEYAIAAAGSLLGITIHKGTGYPVGKVDSLNLFPLSFREFLDAVGEKALREAIDSGNQALLNSFATRYISLLRQYYFVGGMPEAVDAFVETKSFDEARKVQEQILLGYERDISKHREVREIEYTIAAWKSIPAQLSQENKKFVFGHIKEGARARDYRSAITWITQAGIGQCVKRVKNPEIPLSAYVDESAFKLFVSDVGLFCAMFGIDQRSVIEGNKLFAQHKGALTEQYVCQQLVSDCGLEPYYWSAVNSSGEIDFLVQTGGKIYPIEVKAEAHTRARSLNSFSKRYEYAVARRFSMSNFSDSGWVKDVPLFAIGNLKNWD